ncbi:hypothetical protein UG55_1005158 [Frankia sp. EI5c]|nr:hypothetical protein UG55_1005158 [Frankia sp. EI5c]
MKPRSRATLPTLNGGMNRRTNRNGGSVAVYTISKNSTRGPVGRKDLLKARTSSMIHRAIRSSR